MKPPSAPRLLRLYRFVRRRGVPHEETVAYPAIVMLLCVTLSWRFNFPPIWLSANISAIFMSLCGAWLGFAWSKPRYGALAIRIVLISLLIIGGVTVETLFCCSLDAVKAHDYEHLLVVTILAVAMSWGSGFSIGSTTREMTIILFISEEQRAIFEQRWPYRLWTEFLRDFLHNPGKKITYWARLGVDREDKEKATTFDLHMANFIKNHGIKLLLGIICAVIGAPLFWWAISAISAISHTLRLD